MATLDEEQKNAVRKLNREKDELRKENENLKKKLEDPEKGGRGEPASARSSVRTKSSRVLSIVLTECCFFHAGSW